jgi:exopolysaccharide biosynthesis polyprenyl glycosylphosphotransferase
VSSNPQFVDPPTDGGSVVTPLPRRTRGAQLPEPEAGRVALRRDALYRRALAAADIVAAALALIVSVSLNSKTALLAPCLLLVPLIVVASKSAGLYDRDEHLVFKTTLEDAPKLLSLSLTFALLVWMGEATFVQGSLWRLQVLAIGALTFMFALVLRVLARYLARSAMAPERCLVIGAVLEAERVLEKFEQVPGVNVEIVGRTPLEEGRDGGGSLPVLGGLGTLGAVVAGHGIERVIIAPNGTDGDEMLDAIRRVKALGVKVSVVPRLLEAVGSAAAYDSVHGLALLGVRRYGLTNSSNFLKRTMDLVLTVIGVIVIAPLLAAIALAIKLTSRGPVLFRQPRIGRDGREFNIYKFRSMVDGADAMKRDMLALNEAADGLFKIADDPRITSIGRLLRKTSLDELPQLLNVLKGDMSLVGPRPLVPDEDAQIEGWQRRRLLVRPGMTGHWQIFGSSRIPISEMVKIDYLYGANWSLWGDVKIVLRTLPYVLSQRGM